ncbi:D-alanine aminotransferase [Thalassoglobus neptunius]|uniref:D-alanine aminotransferase n=1 Tax=Thalassoglobus neptunius TaxID=1938619 RepID=A0A5C5WH99_9PLAN|nr:aminotransferase class IV [Thalassoglobus neptunius]TWT50030.1 D-alanine aminotransferase [Thalassoglobus neptunius]
MIHPSEIAKMFEQEPLACWNGERLPLSEVRVSVLDRGFLFGDAIYEVIRVYSGKPFLFQDHLNRIQRNLEKMSLPADLGSIQRWIEETISASGFVEASVYIHVTRGVAPRTHRFPDPPPTPNVLIYVAAFHDSYSQFRHSGASVVVVPDQRWKRCDIKSVNLLANCFASEMAHQQGCAEALLSDDSGKLSEGSRSSLFGVKDSVVLTAPLGENILPGITRRLIQQLCEECQLEMREETIHQSQLDEIDELFLTATTMEILPVTRVDDQPIGDGQIGPVSRQLVDAYQKHIERFRNET